MKATSSGTPSGSVMPEVSAVRVLPRPGSPVMPGLPRAGELNTFRDTWNMSPSDQDNPVSWNWNDLPTNIAVNESLACEMKNSRPPTSNIQASCASSAIPGQTEG